MVYVDRKCWCDKFYEDITLFKLVMLIWYICCVITASIIVLIATLSSIIISSKLLFAAGIVEGSFLFVIYMYISCRINNGLEAGLFSNINRKR